MRDSLIYHNTLIDMKEKSKQLFTNYLINLSAESRLLSKVEALQSERNSILDQILSLEGAGPFKVNGRVFTIIKRHGKCHEREIKQREIKVVALKKENDHLNREELYLK